MPERRAIRAANAQASPQFAPILLEAGEFLAPLTLSGIKLYYDGATLFGASVEPTRRARVNQIAVGESWTPIACPARLELAGLELVYDVERVGPAAAPRSQQWDAATVVAHTIARAPLASAERDPFKGQTAIWHAPEPETLVHPRAASLPLAPSPSLSPSRNLQPELRTAVHEAPVVVRANAEPPSRRVHPNVLETSAAVAPTARRGVTSGSQAPVGRARGYLQREFRRTSPAVRWTLLGLPVIAWFTLEPSPPSATAAAAKLAPSAVAAPRIAASQPDEPVPAPAAVEERPSIVLPAIASNNPVTAPRTVKGPERARRSLEARAADAAARGAYAEAGALYQELADLHPDRPEFASAIRILRAH